MLNFFRESGKVCLVHCKKGISRSSSTVIAYAMKEYGWSLEHALAYVKKRRNCITPNKVSASEKTMNVLIQKTVGI